MVGQLLPGWNVGLTFVISPAAQTPPSSMRMMTQKLSVKSQKMAQFHIWSGL
jgi:hypothetical protein